MENQIFTSPPHVGNSVKLLRYFITAALLFSFGILRAQNLTISSNQTLPSGVHYATGDIDIINGATLTLATGAILYMPTNSKIRIKNPSFGLSGSNLIMQPNSKISSDPNIPVGQARYWWGIEVWGQPAYSQLATGGIQRQSRLIVNDAIIENARLAIANHSFTTDPNGDQTAGGIIQISGTSFLNNGISVYMQHYQNFNPTNSQIKWNDYSYFTNCTFTKNSNIFVPFTSDIWLHEVNGINIRGCQFSVQPNSIFQGAGVQAIRADNAGFIIDQFCNAQGPIVAGTPCPSQSLIRSSFTNYERGILAQGLLDFKKITIRNTDFTNNREAIRITAYVNPEITTNTFTKDYVDQTTSIQINLVGCTQFRIEENYIEQTNLPGFPTFSPNYGIIVNNSGQNYNEIYGNTVVNMGYHFQALNVNRWVSSPFNTIGLTYLCNNNSTGLNGAFDFTVDQTNAATPFGIAGSQGFVSSTFFGFEPSMNTFSSKSFSSAAVNHFRNEGEVLNYFHKSQSNQTPIYFSGLNKIGSPLEAECETRWNNLPKDLGTALASLRDDITTYLQNGDHEADQESEEFKRYQAAVSLYAFYTQAAIGQLGQDTAIDLNDIASLLIGDDFEYTFENYWLLATLNQWANFGEDYGLDVMNNVDYTNLESATADEGTLVSAYLQIYNDLRAVDFVDSALSYDLYTEVTNLMSQGNYWAKAMGHYYLSVYFDQIEPSEYVHYVGYSPRRGMEQLQAQKVSIDGLNAYPNPVETSLNIDLPGEESYNVSVTDLTGKRLIEQKDLQAGTRQLDLSALPAGMYLLQVQQLNGPIQNLRIVKK